MRRSTPAILIGLLLVLGVALAAEAQVIRPELQAHLDTLWPADEVDVIITLSDQLDVTLIQDKDKGQRRAKINKALRRHAQTTQGPLIGLLQSRNAKKIHSFSIFNGVAATVPAWVVHELARHRGVASIRLDETLSEPSPQSGSAAPPEWNLTTIRAPELWALGYTGAGTVVASMDTGVDAQHPDLASRWRGGNNSWFDPNGQHGMPYDASGHGTHVMGLMVGGDAGGTSIGAAPGAQWIAVKIFNDSGSSTLSRIHQGFQWLLDPDGNPDVDDAPDVVNNSWHLQNTVNQCNTEFASDIAALKAAGIAVVFAAGNTGPGSATSVSPSNDPQAVAVGAVDQWLTPASFSGRGPSACDGGTYPKIVGPGVSVRSADLTFGGLFPNSYVTVSGTSFATPHLAGGMALLLHAMAARGQSVTLSQLEAAIAESAVDLGAAGPDNDSGMGLLDLVAAYNGLTEGAPPPPDPLVAVNDNYSLNEGATLTVAAPGVLANDSGYATPPGAVLVSGPSRATSFSLNADGSFRYTHNGSETTSDAFVYRVSNASGTVQATVSLTVNPVNDPPTITSSPGTSATVGQPYSYDVNASDPDSATLTYSLTASPTGMTINATTGLIQWTPQASQTGANSVTVRVTDQGGLFATQSFTITVNAPTAVDTIFEDSFESGNFSAWSGRQDTENDLSVTASAALAGGFGMAALIDNNTNMWVRDDTPNAEVRYRARFYFDPNSIPMVNGNTHRIMTARSGDVNAGADVVRIEFRRNSGLYQVRASIANDAGGFTNTNWHTIPDASTPIEIDWRAATAPGANNGSLGLWTAGVLRQTVSGIDNDTLRVRSVRLGPQQGIDDGTRGTVYFDGFVSRRTTYIGP